MYCRGPAQRGSAKPHKVPALRFAPAGMTLGGRKFSVAPALPAPREGGVAGAL